MGSEEEFSPLLQTHVLNLLGGQPATAGTTCHWGGGGGGHPKSLDFKPISPTALEGDEQDPSVGAWELPDPQAAPGMNEGERQKQRGQAAISSSADDEDKDGQGSAGLGLCANGQASVLRMQCSQRSQDARSQGCEAP